MYTFPQLLKKIRSRSELTQKELAKKIGVSPILVSMIEAEQKPVSKNFIIKLAKKMGVSPSSITPFLFADKTLHISKLSKIEKELIKTGEKFQEYLINSNSKNLK